jgi:hypothetical protein
MSACGPSSVQEILMSAQIGATAAAVASVVRAGFEKRAGIFAALTVAAMLLGG